jgi:lipid-A-disaccharide synthase
LQAEVLIVATEASADLHAARVLEELRQLRPDVHAFGMGGSRLRAAGIEALYQAEEMSVMGLAEVLPKIPVILRILRGLGASAAARRPVAALLVDSPDFNLRLAERLKKLGVKVVYYVSPSVWAWRRGRVKTIARVVDRMLCILPFEERFYEGTGVSARFVGHPLAERPPPGTPASYRAALGLAPGRTTVALMPGAAARGSASSRPCWRRGIASGTRRPVRHPGRSRWTKARSRPTWPATSTCVAPGRAEAAQPTWRW